MPMTAEDNAATYRRWFDEGCSRGNVDLADELHLFAFKHDAGGIQAARVWQHLPSEGNGLFGSFAGPCNRPRGVRCSPRWSMPAP
jgi:hypothetical protein